MSYSFPAQTRTVKEFISFVANLKNKTNVIRFVRHNNDEHPATHFTAKHKKSITMHKKAFKGFRAFGMEPLMTFATLKHLSLP